MNQKPNPDKPEPKLTTKTIKETQRRFNLELDSTGSSQTGTQKGKKNSPDFLSSRFLIFLSIFARKLVLRD